MATSHKKAELEDMMKDRRYNMMKKKTHCWLKILYIEQKKAKKLMQLK